MHEKHNLIAHNSEAFDGVFVQGWLIQNRPTSEMHVIHSGQKIMQLTVKDHNIRLIDSLNFLQMPLSKFPETFGLDKSKYSKGDFPFFYNIPENQNYVGPIPDIKYYSPDTKSEKDRSNLITRHEELCETNYVSTSKKRCILIVLRMLLFYVYVVFSFVSHF